MISEWAYMAREGDEPRYAGIRVARGCRALRLDRLLTAAMPGRLLAPVSQTINELPLAHLHSRQGKVEHVVAPLLG